MNTLLAFLLGAYIAGFAFTYFTVLSNIDFDNRDPKWLKVLLSLAAGLAWPVMLVATCFAILREMVRR